MYENSSRDASSISARKTSHKYNKDQRCLQSLSLGMRANTRHIFIYTPSQVFSFFLYFELDKTRTVCDKQHHLPNRRALWHASKPDLCQLGLAGWVSGELHDLEQLCNVQQRWMVGWRISCSLFPKGWLSHQQFVRLLRVIRVAFGQYFHSQLLPFSREKTEVR